MKVYRISKEKMDKMRPSLMTRMAGVFTCILGAIAFLSSRQLNDQTDIRTLLLVIAFFGVSSTYAIFNAVKKTRARMDEMESTFELVLEAGYLTRRQRNLPEITIDYSEIQHIEEHGKQGLLIRADAPRRSVGIPSALENYEGLKDDLALLTGVDIESKNNSLGLIWRYAPVILVIGLMAVSIMASNRLLASGASFLLAAALVVAVILGYRNPSLPRDLKRGLLVGLIPAIALLGRGLLLLRH